MHQITIVSGDNPVIIKCLGTAETPQETVKRQEEKNVG